MNSRRLNCQATLPWGRAHAVRTLPRFDRVRLPSRALATRPCLSPSPGAQVIFPQRSHFFLCVSSQLLRAGNESITIMNHCHASS
jgi:hypothetical protein